MAMGCRCGSYSWSCGGKRFSHYVVFSESSVFFSTFSPQWWIWVEALAFDFSEFPGFKSNFARNSAFHCKNDSICLGCLWISPGFRRCGGCEVWASGGDSITFSSSLALIVNIIFAFDVECCVCIFGWFCHVQFRCRFHSWYFQFWCWRLVIYSVSL